MSFETVWRSMNSDMSRRIMASWLQPVPRKLWKQLADRIALQFVCSSFLGLAVHRPLCRSRQRPKPCTTPSYPLLLPGTLHSLRNNEVRKAGQSYAATTVRGFRLVPCPPVGPQKMKDAMGRLGFLTTLLHEDCCMIVCMCRFAFARKYFSQMVPNTQGQPSIFSPARARRTALATAVTAFKSRFTPTYILNL